MAVTADTVIVGVDPHDMSAQQFAEIQRARNSPAAGAAPDCYLALEAYQVSISFLLAIFDMESTMATNPDAIVVNYTTHSPGNCRSLRPGSGAQGTLISTPRGEYVQYSTWVDGWKDLSFRLIDEDYVYVAEGRQTIREVIERFAPAGDSNDPDAYVNAVVTDMNAWAGQTAAAGDDSRFVWNPDTVEFGYPTGASGRKGHAVDLLIIHVTEGSDSAAWLRAQHGSSTHYLTWRDATPREQHVAEANAAWTAGSEDANLRGINIEFERFARDPWTDAELANAVAACAPIIARHNIPIVYLGRNNAGKRGIIGHCDVADPDDPGEFGGSTNHTDPGSKFPWNAFIAGLEGASDGRIMAAENPLGDYGYQLGFRARLEAIGKAVYPSDVTAGILTVVGWALEDEWGGLDGNTYQRAERATLIYTPHTGVPWDVVLARSDQVIPPKSIRR